MTPAASPRWSAAGGRLEQVVPGPLELAALLDPADQRDRLPAPGVGSRNPRGSVGARGTPRPGARTPVGSASRGTPVEVASTRCFVALLITTVPGSASDCKRAVRLAAAPTMSEASTAPDASPVTTTVPEWTPTRISVLDAVPTPQLGAPVGHPLDQPQAGHHRPSGVVLVDVGYPKHATTPSPWNWRIRPSSSCMASVAASR